MRITQTARLLMLSGVATAALMGPAMALDAQAFVDRVAAVYKGIGYEFTFGTATLDGDTVTVDGGTLNLASTPGSTEPMVFDTEITFSGVAENSDGSYTAKSVTIPDIDTDFSEDPAGHLSVADIRLDGFYLPPGDKISSIGLMQLYQSFSTGPISVTREDAEIISIDSITSKSEFSPAFASMDLDGVTSTMTIAGISADLTSMSEEDPETAEVIEALGLTTVSGEVYLDMGWTMADGRMNINEFSFDFADVGALDLNFDLTGLTPTVLDQIYAMQAAGGDVSEEEAQAQMMQGMALMQGVSIVSGSVRYDDASLAGKLLDFFAAQSDTDRATFVSGIKAMLPSMIAESGIPALNDIVLPPVSAFLDNPQSLEVKVAPPSPTSLLVLMAAAANPAGLITALGFGVEANTAAAD